MSPPASQKIEEDVAKGLSVLQQLTIDPNFGQQDDHLVGAPKHGMPLNEIHFCQVRVPANCDGCINIGATWCNRLRSKGYLQGIAFIYTRKAGLGLSLERGSGFVIAKASKPLSPLQPHVHNWPTGHVSAAGDFCAAGPLKALADGTVHVFRPFCMHSVKLDQKTEAPDASNAGTFWGAFGHEVLCKVLRIFTCMRILASTQDW